MLPISKQDLDCDVVKAVVAHYRQAENKVRIASLQSALFVLKWQAAEKLSGDALARIAIDSVPKLNGRIAKPNMAIQDGDAWTLLDRLANIAVRPHGMSVAEHRRLLDADTAAAKALLERRRRAR